MILGISLKEIDSKTDFYEIIKITILEDNDGQYSLYYINQIMKNHDYCIIIPERKSFPYKLYDKDTYNQFNNSMRNKFQWYSKANHTEDLYHNFIYKAGYSHGIIITSEMIVKEIKNKIQLI